MNFVAIYHDNSGGEGPYQIYQVFSYGPEEDSDNYINLDTDLIWLDDDHNMSYCGLTFGGD